MDTSQSEVKALLGKWSAAARAKDIERMIALYAPDAVYFDVVPPLRFIGSEAIRKNFLRWFDAWESEIIQEIHDLRISASGDVAVAHMLIRAGGTLKGGREVGYFVRATVGCQCSDQGWLIAHEHVSLPVDIASGSAVMDLVP